MMIYIGHIYYLFGILVIIKHLFQLFAFRSLDRVKDWSLRYKEVIGRNPKKKEFRSTEEYDLNETNQALMVFELLWVMSGLFSTNWHIFASIFIGSIIFGVFVKPFFFTFFGKLLSFSFIIVKLLLYLMLIVNHFHYHLDLWELFKPQI